MAVYDANARYRHQQLARLLTKSPYIPPRLDDPALQAELEALESLERAEQPPQMDAELAAATRARIEARRVEDERHAGAEERRVSSDAVRETLGYKLSIASDPPAPLRLAYSTPRDEE
jgi:hypothetical protein